MEPENCYNCQNEDVCNIWKKIKPKQIDIDVANVTRVLCLNYKS